MQNLSLLLGSLRGSFNGVCDVFTFAKKTFGKGTELEDVGRIIYADLL